MADEMKMWNIFYESMVHKGSSTAFKLMLLLFFGMAISYTAASCATATDYAAWAFFGVAGCALLALVFDTASLWSETARGYNLLDWGGAAAASHAKWYFWTSVAFVVALHVAYVCDQFTAFNPYTCTGGPQSLTGTPRNNTNTYYPPNWYTTFNNIAPAGVIPPINSTLMISGFVSWLFSLGFVGFGFAELKEKERKYAKAYVMLQTSLFVLFISMAFSYMPFLSIVFNMNALNAQGTLTQLAQAGLAFFVAAAFMITVRAYASSYISVTADKAGVEVDEAEEELKSP